MTRVHAELTRLFPGFNTGWTARVVPLREQLTGEVRPALFVLTRRRRVRAADRVRQRGQPAPCARDVTAARNGRAGSARRRPGAARFASCVAESLMLSLTGGIAGCSLPGGESACSVPSLPSACRCSGSRRSAIDGPVLMFTVAAVAVERRAVRLRAGVDGRRRSAGAGLKEGGRSGSAARGNRARRAFVVIEVALALVLLAGAGLLVRSFVKLLDVDAGFDPARIVTMKVSVPGSRYGEPAERTQFFQRLFDRLAVLPGVEAVGGTSFLPLDGLGSATSYEVVGQPKPPAGQEPVADVRVVSRDYFKAMGIPLLKGRLFDESDKGDITNRVIINETHGAAALARQGPDRAEGPDFLERHSRRRSHRRGRRRAPPGPRRRAARDDLLAASTLPLSGDDNHHPHRSATPRPWSARPPQSSANRIRISPSRTCAPWTTSWPARWHSGG